MDVYIQRACVSHIVGPPDVLHQLLPGDHLVRRLEKHKGQVCLGACNGHLLVFPDEVPIFQVQTQPAPCNSLSRARRDDACQMAQQLMPGNGIVQVAVGPRHLVGVCILPQEDEGCYRAPGKALKKAVDVKTDGRGIDEDQVRRALFDRLQGFAAHCCNHDLIAFLKGRAELLLY